MRQNSDGSRRREEVSSLYDHEKGREKEEREKDDSSDNLGSTDLWN